MTCNKCGVCPIQIKQSNDGFLFAACVGFPKCKNAVHTIPKNIRNIEQSELSCERCTQKSGEEVQLFRISFYTNGNDEIRLLGEKVNHTFCLNTKCDETLMKIKILSKAIKKAPKPGTFADEMTEE